MPFRAPGTGGYSTPKGYVTRKKGGQAKSYTGKGPAPAGTTKTRERSVSEVPVTTVTSSGKITTSGYPSPAAAARSRRAARRSQRRARRVERVQSTALRTLQANAKKRSQRVATKPVKYTPPKPATSKAPKTKLVKTKTVSPTSTPKIFTGKPTAGTPTSSELKRAQTAGTLKVNRKGYVTTPKVRKVAKKVQRAKKKVAKAEPKIHGLHNKAQEEFTKAFSKASHIPPKLAGEWVRQESGASSAGQGGEAGEQNQLGVGYPAHPTAMSESHYFNGVSPRQAGKNTAKWLEGKIGSEYNYQAAPSIQGISKLAKSGASEDEIRHYIEGPSAWGTGEIAQSGVTVTHGKGAKKAVKQLKAAKKQARSLGLAAGKQTSTQAKEQEYLHTFGKKVRQELKLVRAGKLDKGPGSIVLSHSYDLSQGHESEIAARLKLLSAKLGKPVYIISGYRTPQHSVEVGGFADDPHTKGEAADIGVGSPTLASAAAISEADYESVGLYRPFGTARGGSSAEDNHVQLLNNGTPVLSGGGGSGGSSGSSSGVPSSAITSYASATGQSPAQVRTKLKKKKLTGLQILKRLEKLGVGPGVPSTSEAPQESSKGTTLADLEKKYLGKAA